MNSRKSPIKKISHAGSKLASAAAHRGSQIIDQASAAVQTAVSSTTTLSPIIPRGQQDKDPMERPCRRSGAGIRDRIKKFDSVASSRRKYDESPSSSDRTPHRAKCVAASLPRRPFEKREDSESFPCNPNFRPVNEQILRNWTEDDKENARPITFEENTSKDTLPSKPTPSKFDESRSTHTKLNDEECEFTKRLQRLEEENERLEKINQRLVDKCEALTRENVRLETSSNQDYNRKKDERYGRNDVTKHARKRLSKEHPLISSPLRMHAMAVHEASESNSFVSVRKDPFPLFPPQHQSCSVSEADRSNDAHKTTHESCHLDTLGVLTCNIQKNGGNLRSHVRRADSTSDNDCEKRKNEDALDLLNSAAFLFKNSRRRLN